MIWLTWRQFRTQALVAAAALAAVAVALIATGIGLRHQYGSAGLAGCHLHHDCERLATNFISQLRGGSLGRYELIFSASGIVLYVVPALIGLFWGAPLLTREFETGTVRLAWSQSVSRNRWLVAKVCLIGLAAMATAGLFSLLITWWSSPIDRASRYAGANSPIRVDRLDPALFGVRGIAPIGYAALALLLGVTAGVLIRRTLPAMAVTLAVFTGIQIAWRNWVRPYLLTPLTATAPLTRRFDELLVKDPGHQMTVIGDWHQSGAWVLSNQTVTPAGHLFTGPATSACLGNNFHACLAWLAGKHLLQQVSYQPASRFWPLQWYETAIFFGLAVALVGFSAWRLSRRRLA